VTRPSRVNTAEVVDGSGTPITHAETGATFAVRLGITAPEPALGPNVRIALSTTPERFVAMISNHRWGVDFGTIEGDHVVTMAIVDNPLLPGR